MASFFFRHALALGCVALRVAGGVLLLVVRGRVQVGEVGVVRALVTRVDFPYLGDVEVPRVVVSGSHSHAGPVRDSQKPNKRKMFALYMYVSRFQ